MARWRLQAPHYLHIGEEWEYDETSLVTGRRQRTRYKVPTLLDPKDPTRWTNSEGDIIVCWEGKGHQRDWAFLGNPTPDMDPIDDEAEQVSAKLRPTWIHAIDSLPGQGDFAQTLLQGLTDKLDALASGRAQPTGNASHDQPLSANMVTREEFEALQEQLQLLLKQKAEDEVLLDDPEIRAPIPEPAVAARRM